jgi:tetratricopeptide (TPR) repeat protein
MRIIFVIYCLLIPTLFFSCRSSLPTGVEVEEVNYLMEKGDSCRQADNEENAIIFYYRSLELAKQINVPMLEATASSRLAIIYLYRELYYDALDLFRKAVSIYALAGEDAEQAVALRNIGRTHLMLHHSDSIACYYEQAIEVASHLEDKELLRSISAELEAIYSKGGFYHFSSRLMLKFLDSVSDEAFSSLIAGESYISMRNTEQARVRLKKATQTSDMYICSSAYQLLYEIEKKAKRPEIAVEYAESYIQCRFA